jgi:hypothetical protein
MLAIRIYCMPTCQLANFIRNQHAPNAFYTKIKGMLGAHHRRSNPWKKMVVGLYVTARERTYTKSTVLITHIGPPCVHFSTITSQVTELRNNESATSGEFYKTAVLGPSRGNSTNCIRWGKMWNNTTKKTCCGTREQLFAI